MVLKVFSVAGGRPVYSLENIIYFKSSVTSLQILVNVQWYQSNRKTFKYNQWLFENFAQYSVDQLITNWSFQPYLCLYHLYLINYDTTYHFFLSLRLRTHSVDLHFLPPRCERLLPAHPWPDQEWAYCGRQVRNCHSLFLASLTPRPSQIMTFLMVSAETFLEQTLDLAEEGVLKSRHSGVCMCVLQVLPGSTPLKAHVHINIPPHKNNGLTLMDSHIKLTEAVAPLILNLHC